MPELLNYFMAHFAEEYQRPIRFVAEPTVAKLRGHTWPGNVRELENCLRRGVLICKGDMLLPEHVHFEGEGEHPRKPDGPEDARPTSSVGSPT